MQTRRERPSASQASALQEDGPARRSTRLGRMRRAPQLPNINLHLKAAKRRARGIRDFERRSALVWPRVRFGAN